MDPLQEPIRSLPLQPPSPPAKVDPAVVAMRTYRAEGSKKGCTLACQASGHRMVAAIHMRNVRRAVVWRPTPLEIASAEGRSLPDVIAPGLDVLFCGINPSLYSAAVGHHFARPGNRFWRALHAGGITPDVLSPFVDRSLLHLKCGLTNLVGRATASADTLAPAELVAGARRLALKVRRYRPAIVAFLGVTAFRRAFHRPEATLGLQPLDLESAAVWVLPNPSGLNAHYQVAELGRWFSRLRRAAHRGRARTGCGQPF